MPILLIVLMLVACLPVPWPESPFGLGPWESFLVTVILTMLTPLLTAGLSRDVVRTLERDPDRRSDIVRRYVRGRRILGLGNLLAAMLAIGLAGWGWTVWQVVTLPQPDGSAVLAPGAELLVPAPYVLALILNWVLAYPAERLLHRTARSTSSGYWSLPGYMLFHLRQFVLIVGLPVSLCALQQTLTRWLPDLVATPGYQLGSLAAAVGLFILLPRALKPMLGLKSLPPGPIRDRLEATARRLGIRYTDLLVWPTQGAVANAMVAGVVPWTRYVVFTDRLLEGLEPDELDAVFGHEAGHVYHHHIPYYALFLALSATAATGLAVALDQTLAELGWTIPDTWAGWIAVPLLGLSAVYLFVVFGLLSRRCEQQADVFGCRTGSCADPNCVGHDEATVLVAHGRGLCPTGIAALARALDRVSDLNGNDSPSLRASWGVVRRAWAWLRAWQHGPISSRVQFLDELRHDVARGDRVDRSVWRFRLLLALVLVSLVLVLGFGVGWSEIARLL